MVGQYNVQINVYSLVHGPLLAELYQLKKVCTTSKQLPGNQLLKMLLTLNDRGLASCSNQCDLHSYRNILR